MALLRRLKLRELVGLISDGMKWNCGEGVWRERETGLQLDPENTDLNWLREELNKSASRRFQGSNAEPPRSRQ